MAGWCCFWAINPLRPTPTATTVQAFTALCIANAECPVGYGVTGELQAAAVDSFHVLRTLSRAHGLPTHVQM